MKTSDFNYDLPEELIAQHPPAKRTQARMMVVSRAEGTIAHHSIADIGRFLNSGDLLVTNNTKVIPARVFGKRADTGGKVEVLFLEPTENGETWYALCRASGRPKAGCKLVLADGRLPVTIIGKDSAAVFELAIDAGTDLLAVLEESGVPPLPPYIHRPNGMEPEDMERYQTVYASQPGAIAAPTAGLHFTDDLLADLKGQGVDRCEVTLHVGRGTFIPVKADNVEDHAMESERYLVPAATADAVNSAREAGGRIVAVGTTSVRVLESVAEESGHLAAATGRTELFITPPYDFRCVDLLLTNFHLPKSTLIMMISALAGRELIMAAYEEAVQARYRFYSYGDCMLIV